MLRATQWLVTAAYILCCLSPYYIPGMNQLAPRVGGVPFTIWWPLLMVAIYCVFLSFWSKTIWDTFDGGEKEKKA